MIFPSSSLVTITKEDIPALNLKGFVVNDKRIFGK
jgi:hypothetical protein